MNEEKQIRRRMILVTVWILFVTMTLAGLIVAYNQTRSVLEGYEAQTIIFQLPQSQISIHSLFDIGTNSCYYYFIKA